MNEPVKTAVDVVAGTTGALTLVQWLPPIAALFTIVWTGIRIYEWLRTRKIQE